MGSLETLPIVVLGAGPVGLAAAVRLLERGLEPVILEAAADVAASPRDWGHVRLFSPWRYNVDKAAVHLLEGAGWTAPPLDDLPTGHELYRGYLRPLAALAGIRDRLHLDRRVVAITRHGVDKVRTSRRDEVPLLVRAVSASGVSEARVELRHRARRAGRCHCLRAERESQMLVHEHGARRLTRPPKVGLRACFENIRSSACLRSSSVTQNNWQP